MLTKMTPIPQDFYSFESKAPFTHCLQCNKSLLENDTIYFVEKAIRNYPDMGVQDVIFDYAICADCGMKMRNELSAKSLRHMEDYFATHVDMDKRREQLAGLHEFTKDDWMGQCLVTGQQRSICTEYQIVGHFIGDKLFAGDAPYMLSMEAIDEISNGLSNESIDQLNQFRDDNIDLPPELKDLEKPKLLLI